MKRVRSTSLVASVVCLAALTVPLPAGAGGYRSRAYVGSHNELVRMLRDRCAAAGLTERSYSNLACKDPASSDANANSISQADLNILRARAVSLLTSWYVVPPDEFDLGQSDAASAFPSGYPWLMGKVGNHAGLFTKVPGEHCASGQTIHANDFSDAPILPVHLWELYDVIKRMRFRRAGGYQWWTANGEANDSAGGTGGHVTSWETAKLFAEANVKSRVMEQSAPTAGTWGQNSSYLYQGSIWARYAYYFVEKVPAVSHFARYYCFAGPPVSDRPEWDAFGEDMLCSRWTQWDVQGPTSAGYCLSGRLGSSDIRGEWCAIPFEGKTSRGYSVAKAAVILDFDALYDSPPERFFDGPEWECDGLAFKCRECAPGPDVKWDTSSTEPVASFPAGIPDGMETAGERLPTFFTESFIDGIPRLNYSADTRLLGHCANTEEGWEYAVVARPSGSEVPFALQGTMAGAPVEPFQGEPYRLEKDGDTYVMDLNDGRDARYRFDAVGQAQEISVAPGHHEVTAPVTPDSWLGVSANRSQSKVTSVVSPSMSSQVAYGPHNIANEIRYYNPSGTLLSSVEMSMDGSTRIYREKTGSGVLVRETRVVRERGRTELWRGREETEGFTGTREIRSSVYFPKTGRLVQTITNMLLRAGAEPLSAVSKQVFEWNGRGFQLIARTNGVPGAEATWAARDYYDAPGPSGRLNMLRETQDSEGGWQRYLYDRYDRMTAERRPFGNSGPDANDDQLRITRNYYAGDTNLAASMLPADDISTRHDRRPRAIVEEALGREISRSYTVYLPDALVTKQCLAPGAPYDAASSMATVTRCFTNGQFEGRTRLVGHPDGTLTVFQYAFDAGSGKTTTTVLRGAGTGESVTNGTRTVRIEDSAGRVLEERSDDITSGLALSRTIYLRDAIGRETCSSNAITGRFSTKVYGCCGPERIVDEDGVETIRDYDPLGRVIAEHRLGVSTYYDHDAFGNVVRKIVSAGNEPAVITSSGFDAAGRQTSETNAAGHVTRTSYSTNGFGGRTVTVTHPDGSTSTSSFNRDGSILSETGTAVYPVCREYGVIEGGEYSVEYRGSSAGAAEWTRTESDMLGRTVREERPAGPAIVEGVSSRGVVTSTFFHDSLGRLVRTQVSGFSPQPSGVLSEYNSLGERIRSALDINGNGAIDLAGADRVSESETSVELREGRVCHVSRQYRYPSEGSAERLLVSESFAAVDGSSSWQASFGLTNRTTIVWERESASRIVTSIGPDRVGDVAVYTNGLLVRSARLSASGEEHGVVTYEYDPFGRKSAVHSLAANGEAVTTRFAYDILGRCTNTSVGVGGKIRSSSNEFDVMGRRIRAVLADGAAQEFGYDSRGNLVRQSGSRLYPVTYAYTEQGRMAAMSTYRNGLAGQADTTRWSHDSAQGLLTNKVYADGKGTSYSYTPDGKLSSRTWARSIGPSRLQTSYAYDSLGQMTNISYSDGVTPDVSFAYDRLGRQKTITDGQGTRTFAYDDQLRLVSETQKTAAGTNMLVRSYDESGRHAGLALFSPSDTSNPSYESDYSYDSLGRFCSVSWSNAGESDLRSEYRYSSGDATTITGRLVRANGNTVLQSGTVHDGLGRVTSLRTITASGEVVGNSYGYNDADQRVANVLADGSGWSYRYDELGQLTGGSKRFADGNPVGGSRFEYSFDTIGNRVSAGNFNGQRTKMESYSASGLNQYEQRTVPGQVWVTGEASADARVIARLDDHRPVLASRHGDYFWALVPVSNELGSVSSTNLSITAMLPVPPGSPTGTLVRTETRSVAVPGTPERFAYDEDGNLLSDGLWTYAWDAENRLISVESRSGVPAASSFRCDYSYDYMGRRFCSVRSVSGVATTNFFTYDGWLLLHSSEICHLPSEIRTNASWFVWGPDIAEQMGAGVPRHSAPGATAGGIGGLLFILTPDSCLLTPSFDASGNVTALASTSGAIVASYEYGPFGEPLRASGPAASANPFRFSTKYTDPETGLLYYGYRYYSPSLGRWLSRDPIGEAGGVNAYGACRNDLLTCSDGLGLWGTDVHRDKTIEWAKALRMPESGADLIGEYDDKVDEDFDPKVLVDEKWSWHFDRSSGGEDSRLLHSKEQLALAKRFCDWRHGNRDDWEQASLFVGRSLHPDQDWVAHGDFNRRREAPSLQGQSWLDQRHYWHNWDAPCGTVGAGRNDPDESSLDANGPDGRATIPVLHAGTHLSNGDQTYWAYFHPGQRRLLLTESRTKGTIQDFVEFVKKNGKRCGECERAFVGGP